MENRSYKKESLDDGIVIFTAHFLTHEGVDAWFDDVAKEFSKAAQEGSPTRFVYDLRNISIVSPYALKRSRDLADLELPSDWKVATLISGAFLAEVTNFVRSISLLSPAMYDRSRTFTQLEEALEWLRS